MANVLPSRRFFVTLPDNSVQPLLADNLAEAREFADEIFYPQITTVKSASTSETWLPMWKALEKETK